MTKKHVVLVTGVFDHLHREHVVFLQKAKSYGDVFFVGVERDVRVRQLKGAQRPWNSQVKRVENVQALNLADEVFLLPTKFSLPSEHRALLQKIQPDILAVSSHTPYLAEKEQLMKEIGGRVVVVHQHNPAISTTRLLEKKLKESHGTR